VPTPDNPRYLGVRSRRMTARNTRSATAALQRLASAAEDHRRLQLDSLDVIGEVVPFDVAVHASIDPATLLDTSCIPVGTPRDADREFRHFELEYRDDTVLSYRDLARRPARAAALRLEVEDPRTVPRYREIIEPGGGCDELRATFVSGNACWGSVTLYRRSERFTEADVSFFTSISDVIARGLRRSFLRAAAANPESIADPPGALLLRRSGEVVSTTEAAERWLDAVEPGGGIPSVFRSLIAALDHDPAPQATVPGVGGPVSIHVAAAKGDDAVAAILERPRPFELTPVISAAHGLTPRETDVASAVLTGLTTRQASNRLSISEYTVQDHLKSVFEKVGVATRGELAFELLARHYLPPTAAGATPGPYGFYLDAPS
jgi:DNA-binding CsgD family transcriptional regulator